MDVRSVRLEGTFSTLNPIRSILSEIGGDEEAPYPMSREMRLPLQSVVVVAHILVLLSPSLVGCDGRPSEDEELRRRAAENNVSVSQQKMVDMVSSAIRFDPSSGPECILAEYRVGLSALFGTVCSPDRNTGPRPFAAGSPTTPPTSLDTSLEARLYDAAVFGEFETVRTIQDEHAELIPVELHQGPERPDGSGHRTSKGRDGPCPSPDLGKPVGERK
jgi:hypothetical protein